MPYGVPSVTSMTPNQSSPVPLSVWTIVWKKVIYTGLTILKSSALQMNKVEIPSGHRGPYKTFNHLDIRVPETIRRCIHYKGKNTTWNQVQNGFWTQCIFRSKKLHQDERTTKSCIKTHKETLQNRLAKSASTYSFTMKWVVIHRNTQKGCNTGL